jgi:hypothetical protein
MVNIGRKTLQTFDSDYRSGYYCLLEIFIMQDMFSTENDPQIQDRSISRHTLDCHHQFKISALKFDTVALVPRIQKLGIVKLSAAAKLNTFLVHIIDIFPWYIVLL